MGNRLKRFELLGYAAGLGLVVALVTITSTSSTKANVPHAGMILTSLAF